MKKLFTFLFLLLVIPQLLWGQDPKALPIQTTKTKGSRSEAGVEFMLGAGIYFPGKTSAGYYSGIPTNENNLNYLLLNNYWWTNTVLPLILENNRFLSPQDPIYVRPDGYPADMRYNSALSISLGVAYRFNRNLTLHLNYNYARLVAKDQFLLSFDSGVPSNLRPDYLQYLLVGKERRSFFDLTLSYTFHINPWFKLFVEMGGQFNYVRVEHFDAIIEGQEFNLLDIYGGSTYNGVDIQEFEPHFGGPGGGAVGALGAKFLFNRHLAIVPTFYVSYSMINLEGYKSPDFNFGAYVRFVISDEMFKKL